MNLIVQTMAAQILDPSQSGLPKVGAGSNQLQDILSIVFVITGAIALLIVTIAGYSYITSQGNPQATAKAKDTIIYAGVGLAISLIAFSIVNFVIGRVT